MKIIDRNSASCHLITPIQAQKCCFPAAFAHMNFAKGFIRTCFWIPQV